MKIRISGFWLRQGEVLVRDRKYVSSATSCLICVSASKSDGRHKPNPSFHAITKICRILEALAVLMVGLKKKKSVNFILKALQEQPSDQVV